MREQWKNKNFWIILLSESLVIFLAVYFIFLPLARSIINKSNKIQETKIDKELIANRLSRIKEARQEHEKIASGIGKMDVLLGEEEEVKFFKELEAIAESTGNTISIKIVEEGKKDNTAVGPAMAIEKEKKEMLDSLSYKKFFILQINLKGEYSGLVNFLHKLENMNHYLTVISVNAQKVKELPTGEIAPVVNYSGQTQIPKEIEKLNSLITVAVYRK